MLLQETSMTDGELFVVLAIVMFASLVRSSALCLIPDLSWFRTAVPHNSHLFYFSFNPGFLSSSGCSIAGMPLNYPRPREEQRVLNQSIARLAVLLLPRVHFLQPSRSALHELSCNFWLCVDVLVVVH